jgi:hypothetical protein
MSLYVYDMNVLKDYRNQEAPLVVNVLILIAMLAFLILVRHYHV